MSGDGLTEAERKILAVARHSRLALTEEQIAAVERIVADRLVSAQAELERLEEESAQRFAAANMLHAKWQDAEADRHVVHVTAKPIAEDVVWCEDCEEWVTAGAAENAAVEGGAA